MVRHTPRRARKRKRVFSKAPVWSPPRGRAVDLVREPVVEPHQRAGPAPLQFVVERALAVRGDHDVVAAVAELELDAWAGLGGNQTSRCLQDASGVFLKTLSELFGEIRVRTVQMVGYRAGPSRRVAVLARVHAEHGRDHAAGVAEDPPDEAAARRRLRANQALGNQPAAWRRAAATPRPRRGYSAETGRGAAAAATWTFRGNEPRAAGTATSSLTTILQRRRRRTTARRPGRASGVAPARRCCETTC